MITLKPFLDAGREDLSALTADCYNATLKALAESAVRCCPATGKALQAELSAASKTLKTETSAKAIKAMHKQVLKALSFWGEQSEIYFKRKAVEVKEILTELVKTADFIGKRDQRYTRQFNEITMHLEAIAQLDDLNNLRSSILHSAGELRGCVERMAKEGADSTSRLQHSLATYRVELDRAQELASLDPLTGLFNRREVEARIARRLAAGVPFCLVVIDLDRFKAINDKHGHLVGDEVLRQVAKELRLVSREDETIGRWGGDEFVMIFDGNFTNTKVKVQRMRPWVFGTYQVELSSGQIDVVVNASIGVAEWAPGETMLQVISRADADMYRDKSAAR
jgi:diguanylate cyclase (GGDEF)-like protein